MYINEVKRDTENLDLIQEIENRLIRRTLYGNGSISLLL